MKTIPTMLASAGLTFLLLSAPPAFGQEAPPPDDPVETTEASAPGDAEATPPEAAEAARAAPVLAPDRADADSAAEGEHAEVPEGMPPSGFRPDETSGQSDRTLRRSPAGTDSDGGDQGAGYLIRPARRDASASAPRPSGERNLRLNFRGAPLDLVLDYLSEAAGFIIVLETEVKGKLDVWSNQPVSQAEAVDLLNQVLAKNGYAALQEGRTLTVVTKDEAKKRDTPVRMGSDPAGIPRSDQVVTQIIPVKFVNAVQLSRDLQPLFPTSATIAANEGGNAIVITDTLTNIRRVAEIIKALDTAISSVSAVRVFALQYADAKSLATVIRDLFQAQNARASGNQQQVQRGFRGGGPGGGFPGMPGAGGFGQGGNQGGQGSSSGGSRVSSPSVVAVADERSNAVVVSAPEDQMPVIEDLVKQVDVNVDDITELRVFALQHADAQEMADLLTELFPDTTRSSQAGNRGQVRFGGPGGFGGGFGGASNAGNSTRQQQQTKVSAVADMRTRSVVVSTSRDLMPEIAQIVAQLDSDPARKQKVHVFSVENTDPAQVEEILRGLFETQNTRNRSTTANRSNTRQAGSQLNNRATSNMQNMGRTTARTGSTGFGTTTGMGTAR